MNKSCGGCQYWVKLKVIKGLCEKHDWACNSDVVCKDWKGKKFNRVKVKDIQE